MGLYTNCECDVCHKKFTDDDDVVICPICGTPQHRACYQANHGCVHADKHASGYEWKRPEEQRRASSENFSDSTVTCARCGAQNPAGFDRCRICGALLGEAGPQSRQQNFDAETTYEGRGFLPDFEVDGVSSREIASYLGPGASQSFLPKFNLILQRRSGFSTWNFPALIFGPFYFLYRKIKKMGWLLLLLLALIYVPSVIYTLEYFKAFYAPEMFGITLSYSQRILDIFSPIVVFASYARIALHLFCCATANSYFLRQIVSDIKEMQHRFPTQERGENYRTALFYRGRPTLLPALLAGAALFAAIYIAVSVSLISVLPK